MNTTDICSKIKQIKARAEKEHNEFYDKHLKSSKDEIVIVLKTHLFVENILDQVITAFLPKPKELLGKTFSDKIDIIKALNLPVVSNTNTVQKLRALNKIRNKFAHNLDYRINQKDIEPLQKGLNLDKTLQTPAILRYTLGHLTGFLIGSTTTCFVIPFFATCMSHETIFAKDFGFDIQSIIKNHYPDDLLKLIRDYL
jgi:uncharacterized protein YutE (UPF0331/DUF86 family)